jgi:para-nitrobenzyl esterase
MKHISCLTVTVLLATFVFSFRPADLPFSTVKITGGVISGTVSKNGEVHAFKGIPFAAPPLGDFRWKEPQPVLPWAGLKQCDIFGPSPMQASPFPFGPWSQEYLIPKEPISEDCLYLNVWTGAKTSSEKRPVIVWIYGGGFGSGGTAVPVYDGEAMAKKGIVFVSVNYRVGVFGFLAHPELTKESPHHASGNYGLLDQVAGLRWVQENIAAFGGDPGNVTIAGQSAGSMSVNCLVASPLCRGLFQHAIAESGAGFIAGGIGNSASLQNAEEAGTKMAESLQAISIAALRKIPAAELQSKARGFFRPITDGYLLPESIAETFAKGKQNDVALLTGWNEDDGVMIGKPKTAAEFQQQVKQQYGNDATALLQYYPSSNEEEALRSQVNLSRDQTFGMQNYAWANVQNEKGKAPVYVYRFARRLPATGDYERYGAFHTGEVAYAYNNLDFVKRCSWQPADRQLAEIMSSYWVNFAASGNPNGKGLPQWPAYKLQDKKIIILGDTMVAAALPDTKALDLLISLTK